MSITFFQTACFKETGLIFLLTLNTLKHVNCCTGSAPGITYHSALCSEGIMEMQQLLEPHPAHWNRMEYTQTVPEKCLFSLSLKRSSSRNATVHWVAPFQCFAVGLEGSFTSLNLRSRIICRGSLLLPHLGDFQINQGFPSNSRRRASLKVSKSQLLNV